MFKKYFKGSLTIPNLMSFCRILIVPIFAWLYFEGQVLAAFILLVLSGLSDLFDGKIARKLNQVSEMGKMLDPIADKLTVIAISLILFYEFNHSGSKIMHIFSWVFLFFLLKEAVMIIGGVIMVAMGLKPGAAEIYGKIATNAFYYVTCAMFAFGPEVGAISSRYPKITIPEPLCAVLVVICAILTLVAFLSYMPGVAQQLRERSGKDKTNP